MSNRGESGYETEPEEHFAALPADLYGSLYHLEMAAVDDKPYYRALLRRNTSRSILELGCGTGRIADYLRRCGFSVIGIDNSRPMLSFARATGQVPMIEMDMCCLGLRPGFDTVIIAGNTLNLLCRQETIGRCLRETRAVLLPAGLLILHLFVPDRLLIEQAGQRFFQYALFDLPEGGTLVKETLRSYDPQARLLHLEERYKLRFLPDRSSNRNYRQTHRLAAFPATTWCALLEESGFVVRDLQADFGGRPYRNGDGATLLVTAQVT